MSDWTYSGPERLVRIRSGLWIRPSAVSSVAVSAEHDWSGNPRTILRIDGEDITVTLSVHDVLAILHGEA